MVTLGLASALAVLIPVPESEAQSLRYWQRRSLPGVGIVVPLPPRGSLFRRGITPVPNYFFENRSSIFGPRRPFGHNDLTNSLRARGFKDVGVIQQRGSTFITEATGPSGERVRLVINGLTGGIDGVRVIGKGS